VPNHGIHLGRRPFLDGGEQVISVAGGRGLWMSESLSSVHETPKEQYVLAVLRNGKVMNCPDPTAAVG
jgi:hypothetical protein